MNDQAFEKWLQEALATDVTAPEDFTARVMDRVAATPQEYPRKNTADKRKLKRMMTALAACAAIIVLIPVGLLMMPKGSSAPAADCAAPEMAMDDAAADMEYFADGVDNYNDAAGLGRVEEKEEAAIEPADDGMTDGGEEEQHTTTSDGKMKATVVHLFGDEAAQARMILAEMGCECASVENGAEVYNLTATETAVLREALPALIDCDGALCLTLEVEG